MTDAALSSPSSYDAGIEAALREFDVVVEFRPTGWREEYPALRQRSRDEVEAAIRSLLGTPPTGERDDIRCFDDYHLPRPCPRCGHGQCQNNGSTPSTAERIVATPAGERERIVAEKRAPVQGYPAGIPWWLHLQAYAAYCKKWGPQPAMIDLDGRNCRGGFSDGELDDFVPGWREMLDGFVVQPRDLRHVDDLTIRKVFTFEQAEKLLAARDHLPPGGGGR